MGRKVPALGKAERRREGGREGSEKAQLSQISSEGLCSEWRDFGIPLCLLGRRASALERGSSLGRRRDSMLWQQPPLQGWVSVRTVLAEVHI